MPEPSPSLFHHQSVTLFPKSSNYLTLSGNKPQQPVSIPNTPLNTIQNINMQIRPL